MENTEDRNEDNKSPEKLNEFYKRCGENKIISPYNVQCEPYTTRNIEYNGTDKYKKTHSSNNDYVEKITNNMENKKEKFRIDGDTIENVYKEEIYYQLNDNIIKKYEDERNHKAYIKNQKRINSKIEAFNIIYKGMFPNGRESPYLTPTKPFIRSQDIQNTDNIQEGSSNQKRKADKNITDVKDFEKNLYPHRSMNARNTNNRNLGNNNGL